MQEKNDMDFLFVTNSLLLGVGLAMDAFCVSLASGLSEPQMRRRKSVLVAGTFAFFQALMPLLGWLAVHTLLELFSFLSRLVPWAALLLLTFLGVRMLLEGRKAKQSAQPAAALTFGTLLLQGIATSIDALSVGFTIADYALFSALVAALLIAAVTFVLCLLGVFLGKRFGTRFSGGADVLGGVILIVIGLEIFLKGVVFA